MVRYHNVFVVCRSSHGDVSQVSKSRAEFVFVWICSEEKAPLSPQNALQYCCHFIARTHKNGRLITIK